MTVSPFSPYAMSQYCYPNPAYRLYLLVLIIISCSLVKVSAQPAVPQFKSFTPINSVHSAPPGAALPMLPGQVNPLLRNDPYRDQNYRVLQQAGMDIPGQPANNRQQSLNAMRDAMQEEAREEAEFVTQTFRNSLLEFLQLNPEKFSITKAVYLTECAYDPSLPPFEQFEGAIKEWANLVKQIIKREGLNLSSNTAINYAIQKLYSQYNTYYNPKTKKTYNIPPIRYDHEDFMGEKDWSKMFLSKLLRTKTGQCHSMPLFFLCLAEQLNAKAWLSLSPSHSFIQYFDEAGNRYNFEPTNGNLVTQTWLMQSTFINATALKNKTYLDTLSSKKLYAQCLSDLLLGYLMKVGYNQFSDHITDQILANDPSNITALMTRANLDYFIFRDRLRAAGNPPESHYPDYPGLNAAFKNMQEARLKVEQTGFQEMPEQEYQKWLKSLELEKQKQQQRMEQQKLQQQIKKLKNIKSVIINQPKG